mmetsp:Transcript_62490/g.172938  ORF Transcript_62490/g.172938 Transcript_62490/m.172938 type:complete len:218 (-) Transcript_62490:40-693(-)
MHSSASLPAVRQGGPRAASLWSPCGSTVSGSSSRRRLLEVSGHRSHEFQRSFNDAYTSIVRNRNISSLERLFSVVDLDGSGQISAEEFSVALRMRPTQAMFAQLGLQPHQVMLLFKVLDTSSDGSLSREEFLEGLLRIACPEADGCRVGEVDAGLLRAAKFGKTHSTDNTPGPARASRRGDGISLLSRERQHVAFVRCAFSQALHAVSAKPSARRRR